MFSMDVCAMVDVDGVKRSAATMIAGAVNLWWFRGDLCGEDGMVLLLLLRAKTVFVLEGTGFR